MRWFRRSLLTLDRRACSPGRNRTAYRVSPVPVLPDRSHENSTLDQIPDPANHRDQGDQAPPARLVAVVPALGRDGQRRIEQHEAQNDAQQAAEEAVAEDGADHTATDEVDSRENERSDPERLPSDAAIEAGVERVPIHFVVPCAARQE